ncbi:hypothetical protein THF1D04_40183 [Vibrio owensii]|uniref:Uncharacterized protein n=1 Tax=Vibrio owensii TaxID=696485 RepID=A0AAU9QA86_9VIBR|nr:hypothetical protein THF1D04_40183 [Vibrio owensii]
MKLGLSLENMEMSVTALSLNNIAMCLLKEAGLIDKDVPFEAICVEISI